MDGTPRRQWSFTPHMCSHLTTEGRTQKSERDRGRSVATASRPEQLRTIMARLCARLREVTRSRSAQPRVGCARSSR
eukprot:6643141-Prymnesium_polylepis.1